jgi:TolB protein
MISRILKVCLLIFTFVSIAGCSTGGNSNPETSSNGRNDLAYPISIQLEGSMQNPAWSPDGKSVVFTRFRNGYNEGPSDLAVYDFETGTTKILVSDGSDNINLPGSTWNRATNQIVFSSSRGFHDEIFMINADEDPGKEIKITERAEQVAYEPTFSPDGQWVVFESHEVDVENQGVITKYKIDGTEPYKTLTDLDDDCRQPNWSPDGDHIAYQEIIEDQWNIWVMNSDGTNPRQMTSGPGDKTDASFSPDGQWIVYSADGPTLRFANLFVIPVAGGEQIQLTHSNGYDGAPSWSPEGDKIVFESSLGAPEDSPGTTIWIMEVLRWQSIHTPAGRLQGRIESRGRQNSAACSPRCLLFPGVTSSQPDP